MRNAASPGCLRRRITTVSSSIRTVACQVIKVMKEREREVWRAAVAPHSLYQIFCFAFDQMSSWYSAAGHGRSGSYGSWYGRRRGSWGGKSQVRSEVEWFCQKCSAGNWWSRTECRYCASATNENAQTSIQEKTAVLEKTLAGQRRAYFSWQESSGKRARETPEETQWPNASRPRAKLAEMQGNLRVRKET